MRSAGTIIFLLFLTAIIDAQTVAEQLLSNPNEAVCGKPLADGKVYDYREGRVSSITAENKLVFEQNELNGSPKVETLRIRLAGIDLKIGDVRLNTFLKKNLIGRDVTVAGNKRNTSDGELLGSVWVSSHGDLNQHLLKNRVAAFAEPDYESISAYRICVLRQIVGKPRK